MSQEFRQRLARRLEWQKAINDPKREPRNRLPTLSLLRQWQSKRLEAGFQDFLQDPTMRPAAQFFLSDLYADRDFSARDRDAAKVLPMMSRFLPDTLLRAATDAIELAVLSHAFDLRLAEFLADAAVVLQQRRVVEDEVLAHDALERDRMLVELAAGAARFRGLRHRLLRLRLQPVERQDQFRQRIDERQAHQQEAQQNEFEE